MKKVSFYMSILSVVTMLIFSTSCEEARSNPYQDRVDKSLLQVQEIIELEQSLLEENVLDPVEEDNNSTIESSLGVKQESNEGEINSSANEIIKTKPEVNLPTITKAQNIKTIKRIDDYRSISLNQGGTVPCFDNALYDREIDNELKVSMGDYGDLYIRVYDLYTDEIIREHYIRQNTTYSIMNIPEGKYYIKTAFGSGPMINDKCQFKFNTQAYYKKGENIFDFNIIKTREGFEIPYFHLSLNVEVTFSEGSTYDSESITENQFNN